MKVALVHYWLTKMRGGEQVLEALCEMFPDADIFTHVYDPTAVSETIRRHKVETTFISKLPFSKSQYQKYLPFMPRALEELDLTEYDLIISSESGPAKGIVPRPDAFHLCYCHSPMRYLWDHYHSYRSNSGLFARAAFPHIAHRMRQWDATSAMRVDQFVANSAFIAQRIQSYYRRSAEVVAPPVKTKAFAEARQAPGDFYLAAGEFVAYKKFDIAIEAFNRLGARLLVIGAGEEETRLKAMARDNIEFLGRVDFESLKSHFAACQALIFPGEEDFGMIPVEVMATGRPVIALGRGGALDSVVDGKTGVHYQDPSVEGLISAVQRFEDMTFDSDAIQSHANTFNTATFKRRISEILIQNGLLV